MEFVVFRGVYEPREDSWLLVDAVNCSEREEVLEMGCGSGLASVKAAMQGARVTAVDISKEAVKNTLENARRNRVKVRGIVGDLFAPLNPSLKFDAVFFNPPYLPETAVDPESVSWAGGRGGAEIITRFLRQLPSFLKTSGRCFIVLSSLTDRNAVAQAAEESGLKMKKIRKISFFFEKIELWEIRREFY